MCGIIGCIQQNNTNTIQTIIDGLSKLQNRGYDSAGLAYVNNNFSLHIKKFVSDEQSAVSKLKNIKLDETLTCIGHTRWATHGGKTLENSHPHHDESNRFALIHNGIIENYLQLKLSDKNYYGQTDTEVCVKYLAKIINSGGSFEDLNNKLSGSWALLIVDKFNPQSLYFLKNGSPLLLGYNHDQTKIMLVSELVGFDFDIEYYYPLIDNEVGTIHIHNNICQIQTKYKYEASIVPKNLIQLTPDPFDHWTIKEIYDQPLAIKSLLDDKLVCMSKLNSKKDIYINELNNHPALLSEHFIFLGCGTSLHAAKLGTYFFKQMQSIVTVDAIDGADFELTDLPVNKSTTIILLSQSGETKDLYKVLKQIKHLNIPTIGFINVENSLMAREVDVCIYLKAGRENAVASTKSFTNQVIMMLMLACKMNPNNIICHKYILDLDNLSSTVSDIITNVKDQCQQIAQTVFEKQTDCFILGKHKLEWIAREGSLKIKEITYVHAEGYSASALKHGPFALLTSSTPVFILINDNPISSGFHDNHHIPKMLSVIEEIKSRSSTIICITNSPQILNSKADHIIFIDTKSSLFDLLTIIPIQLIAYYLSLHRSINPDFPRNLAKVVTVE